MLSDKEAEAICTITDSYLRAHFKTLDERMEKQIADKLAVGKEALLRLKAESVWGLVGPEYSAALRTVAEATVTLNRATFEATSRHLNAYLRRKSTPAGLKPLMKDFVARWKRAQRAELKYVGETLYDLGNETHARMTGVLDTIEGELPGILAASLVEARRQLQKLESQIAEEIEKILNTAATREQACKIIKLVLQQHAIKLSAVDDALLT